MGDLLTTGLDSCFKFSPFRRLLGDCIEKALVFYSAALKAFTSFYDDPISDSPSAPGTQSFNV
jgi:hypothetical protein